MHVPALQQALESGGGVAEDDCTGGNGSVTVLVGSRLIHSGHYFTPNKDRDCGQGEASHAVFTYVGSSTILPPVDQILLAGKS